MVHKPKFADIADLEEDRRIDVIGHRAIDHRETVAFVTDDDPGKADRYIRKLKAKFPLIEEIERGKGPVKGTVYIKVRRKADA